VRPSVNRELIETERRLVKHVISGTRGSRSSGWQGELRSTVSRQDMRLHCVRALASRWPRRRWRRCIRLEVTFLKIEHKGSAREWRTSA